MIRFLTMHVTFDVQKNSQKKEREARQSPKHPLYNKPMPVEIPPSFVQWMQFSLASYNSETHWEHFDEMSLTRIVHTPLSTIMGREGREYTPSPVEVAVMTNAGEGSPLLKDMSPFTGERLWGYMVGRAQAVSREASGSRLQVIKDTFETMRYAFKRVWEDISDSSGTEAASASRGAAVKKARSAAGKVTPTWQSLETPDRELNQAVRCVEEMPPMTQTVEAATLGHVPEADDCSRKLAATINFVISKIQTFLDWEMEKRITPCMDLLMNHPSLHVDAFLFGSRWYSLGLPSSDFDIALTPREGHDWREKLLLMHKVASESVHFTRVPKQLYTPMQTLPCKFMGTWVDLHVCKHRARSSDSGELLFSWVREWVSEI
jgi:hypothetical protein